METILFYDTETSGIPKWELPADDPSQPRIVQLGLVLCDHHTGAVLTQYESIVEPEGWIIGEEVAKIHGITHERALAEGRPIDEVLDNFDRYSTEIGTIACYNLRFDEKLLRGERRRLNRPDGFGTVKVFCVMKGATPVCKLPYKGKNNAGKYKSPKLTEAVRDVLNREHVGAHGALADAIATKDIYFALRENPEFMAAGADFKSNEAHAT